jgi:hypothetical protein
MLRRLLAVLVCFAFCVGPAALAQDKTKDAPPSKGGDAKKDDTKKDDKEEMKEEKGSSGRVRGFLPANYRKLGLSAEQTQKIYKIQNEYDDKIKDMEDKIAEMKAKRNKSVEGVLTEAQKARLKEILTGKDKDK